MNNSDYRFTLDVQIHQAQVSVPVTFGDSARRLSIGLTDGRKPYVIGEGCRAVFNAKKPDGNTIKNDCIIERNVILYEFTEQTTNAEGVVNCDITILAPNGKVLTSPQFTIVVDKRVVRDAEIIANLSVSQSTTLDKIIESEAERQRQEEGRQEAENYRASSYDTAEAERDRLYGVAEGARDETFAAKEAERKAEFDASYAEIKAQYDALGVVQTPGDSETQVMSQKATTEYVKDYAPKVATRNLWTATFEQATIANSTGRFLSITSQDQTASPEYIAVIGGENYTFSCIKSSVRGLVYLHEYKAADESAYIQSSRIGATDDNTMPYTIQVDTNCAFVRIHLYAPTAPTSWEELIPENFQMELGTEATVYVPPFAIDNDVIDDVDLAERMRTSGAIPKVDSYIVKEDIYNELIDCDLKYLCDVFEIGANYNNESGNTTYIYADVVEFEVANDDVIGISVGSVENAPRPNSIRIYGLKSDGKWVECKAISSYSTTTVIPKPDYSKIRITLYPSVTGGLTDTTAIYRDVRVWTSKDGYLRIKGVPPNDECIIPSYYFHNDYLKNKVDTIRNYISASNGNYDVFIFCTDMHWTLNAKNSPHLIDYLTSKIHINRLFTGGDLANGINMDVIKALNTCFKGSLYNVSGNHEYFGEFEEDGQKTAQTITGSDVWQYLDGQMIDAIVGDASKNYYYVDNVTQKMRYIVLASYTEDLAFELGADQEVWLRDTALNMPDGYTAIIFTHSMGTENTENNTLNIHGAGTTIVNICDASEASVACIIAGHTHVDIMTKTPMKQIPIFVTTCDKYGHWIDNEGVDREPWLSNRVEGTITEQAFDVFVVDKTNRQINAVRIGCPAIDGAITGLEVRTQAY